ncbi:MAG: nucleotidyltransferase domain-containing protein [Bacteroidota bacterium]|nr:nucleotidyltransferase domain-containing protein [Bacteroidota bacterium]
MEKNNHITMKEIRAIAKRIAEKFNVEKIILFGSYAYGKPKAGSDVDLLIVMNTDKRHYELRYQIYSILEDFKSPVDVVIKKPEDVRAASRSRDWFLQDIVNKGRVIYG